jgi:hypothetical protein
MTSSLFYQAKIFYNRDKSQIIQLTGSSLNINLEKQMLAEFFNNYLKQNHSLWIHQLKY